MTSSAPFPHPALVRVAGLGIAATLLSWLRVARSAGGSLDDVQTRLHQYTRRALGVELDHVAVGEDGVAVPLVRCLAELPMVPATHIYLALPVPGDTAGLGQAGALSDTAVQSGHAVLLTHAPSTSDRSLLGPVPDGLGLVAQPEPGRLVRWRLLPRLGRVGAPTPAPVAEGSLDAVDNQLSVALRDAARALAQLDVAAWGVDASTLRSLHEQPPPPLPRTYPPAAHRITGRATSVLAMLALAQSDPMGGALNSHEVTQRAAAFRAISANVRHAYAAALNVGLAEQ